MSWPEWLMQGLLAGLLLAAMPFLLRLHRSLQLLRRERGSFEGGAAGLTEATRIAEAAAIRLRAAAESSGRQVAERIATAEPLRDDLRYLVERAEALADRLEGLVRSARPLATAEAPQGRSQAERELARVLEQTRQGAGR
jgi:hypothetical protein